MRMKVKSNIFYWYIAIVIAYVLSIFLPSPNPVTLSKYHLSSIGLRFLDLTLILPILIIYFAAYYGYAKLGAYAQAIKDNKDGQAISWLARGLMVLALGLPFNSFISTILLLIARYHPSFTGGATIINNYIGILYLLLTFIFISIGTRMLTTLAKTRLSFKLLNIVVALVIMLGVGYCALVAKSHHSITASYHLSVTMVMLTMVIPFMYLWFLGLYATAELYLYSKKLKGIVYRKGWNQLALGLATVIGIVILEQYLSTISTWLNSLTLAWLVLLLYVLLLILAAAFIVIALGTKKLIKIEEA